jgi:hypothetical protein
VQPCRRDHHRQVGLLSRRQNFRGGDHPQDMFEVVGGVVCHCFADQELLEARLPASPIC